MALEPQTYFRDDSESPVDGILVLEEGDDEVRVTENYEDMHWCKPFWMPESEFRSSVVDTAENVGLLSDDKADEVVRVATSESL